MSVLWYTSVSKPFPQYVTNEIFYFAYRKLNLTLLNGAYYLNRFR